MSDVDVTRCLVCSEMYQSDGHHVPMLLPCTHSVCERCLKKKLFKRRNNFDCPQCGVSHSTQDGTSKNSYIITYIKKMAESEEPKEKCSVHHKIRSLFCNSCQTPICALCLKNGHKDHDLGDLEEVKEQRLEHLMVKVSSLKKKLNSNKEKLLTAQKNESKNCQTCIKNINNSKKKQIKKLEKKAGKLIQKVTDKKAKMDEKIQNAVGKIDESLVMVESIEETTNKATTHTGITERLHTICSMKDKVANTLSEVKNYTHVIFEECKTPNKMVRILCGQVTQVEECIKFTKIKNRAKDKSSVVEENNVQENDIGVEPVKDPSFFKENDVEGTENSEVDATTKRISVKTEKDSPLPSTMVLASAAVGVLEITPATVSAADAGEALGDDSHVKNPVAVRMHSTPVEYRHGLNKEAMDTLPKKRTAESDCSSQQERVKTIDNNPSGGDKYPPAKKTRWDVKTQTQGLCLKYEGKLWLFEIN